MRQDETESRLALLWQEVLGVQVDSFTADFFDLGGDSLRAVQLAIEIERTFGVRVPVSVVYRRTTIEQLARLLRQRDSGEEPGNERH